MSLFGSCEWCGEDETVEHVIMYCERYKEDRDTLFQEKRGNW